MRLRMSGASFVVAVGMIAAGLLAASAGVGHAQAGLWAIDTNACTPDGTRCIKGIVKTQPYPTLQACQKNLAALNREYHAAGLNVMYMRCVMLR